jgi:hypothetical protein
MTPGDTPLDTFLLVRDGRDERLIRTLEDALAFIKANNLAEREGNRDATIFRLESAREPDAKANAAKAFRAWAEAAGVLIEARAGA